MSYIQVEIGGRLRGLKFNQGAIMWMQDKVDFENYAATAGYATAWGGLKSNCYVKGEELTKTVNGVEVPATFEDVCEWVDELDKDTALKIADAFKESSVFKKLIEENDKKKLVEVTTEQSVTELPVDV